jgi:hypothetical protein
MHTKTLMTLSALFMAILGLACTFMPQEIAARYGAAANEPTTLLIQVTGALYVAFAILNWTVRNSPIGGIYNRPIAMANVLHFVVVALALLKETLLHAAAAPLARSPGIIAATVLYAVFAIWFALVLTTHPIKQ